MRIARLSAAVAAATLLVGPLATATKAQNYPDKVVRYIVTDGPGGGADVLGRIVAAGLTEEFGQQVIVENRPGAAGNIGMEAGAKAPPGGYVIVQASSSHTANVSLYRGLKYDLIRDFEPITQLSWLPAVVAVNPNAPFKTLGDLLKAAKEKPGSINYSSMGVGSAPHLATELFKAMSGAKIEHVGYKSGGEALMAVVSGEVPVYFPPIGPALPQIKQGKLRALAVTSEKRAPILPDVPTVAEAGVPGYEAIIWHGLMVPAKTSPEVVSRIHTAVVAVLKKPAVRERLQGLGFFPVGSSPAEFGDKVKKDIALQAKVLKEAGVDKPF